MIEIKQHLSLSDWEEFHFFVSEAFRPDHPLCSREYVEWQFKIKKSGDKATILCAWEDGKLLGINGYIPILTHWGRLDKSLESVWLAHWRVSKSAPRGVGALLIRKIQQMFPLAMSLNASQMGVPIFKALGWSYIPDISRYICVLDQQKSVNMLALGFRESDLDSFVFKAQRSNMSSVKDSALNAKNYHPSWKLYPQLAFGVIRSLDYLKWRYIEHPVFKYHVIVIGQADRPAVCVYRIEEAFGSFQTSVARIVDFFFPDDDQGRKDGIMLMSSILQHLKNSGCAYADFICSNKMCSQVFTELGADKEPLDRLILPMRLTPIQQFKPEQNFVYYGAKDLPVPTFENLYVTKSDVDGDHPVRVESNSRIANVL